MENAAKTEPDNLATLPDMDEWERLSWCLSRVADLTLLDLPVPPLLNFFLSSLPASASLIYRVSIQ